MNIAIILSGGVGSRMGMNMPKQYLEVNGKPIIWFCLKVFNENPNIDAIVIGRAEEWSEFVEKQIQSLNTDKPVFYSIPGETRQYSIFNALKVVKEYGYTDDDVVIIHDAARPLVSHALIDDCLMACAESDAVLPVIPVKDTLYQSVDGKSITNLLRRNELFAGQAPEAFRFGKYLRLHEKTTRNELLEINGSTEIAYKGGLKVKLIKGDEMNFKITTPEDLSNFENIINQRNNESIRTT